MPSLKHIAAVSIITFAWCWMAYDLIDGEIVRRGIEYSADGSFYFWVSVEITILVLPLLVLAWYAALVSRSHEGWPTGRKAPLVDPAKQDSI